MRNDLHVVPYRNGWDVIYKDARYAESHHATREDAISAGALQARRDNVDLLVFDSTGRLCMHSTYHYDHDFSLR